MPLKVQLLNPLATAPTIAHPNEDLGYDVYALRIQGQPVNPDGTPVQWVPARPGMPTRIDTNGKIVHPIRIEAGRPLTVDTGISACYQGLDGKTHFGLLVRDRSSLASKGIFVTAGVIDSGYRGEIKIILNLVTGSYADLWPGNKIAQLIPIPIYADRVEMVEELEESSRQEDGFGSSGT
jgi:dUTP pyrophosphatase